MTRNAASLPYLCNFRNRSLLGKQFSSSQMLKSKEDQLRDKVSNHDRELYKRMKTVFGHANMTEGSALAVYNCKFDMSGRFIITGADDG